MNFIKYGSLQGKIDRVNGFGCCYFGELLVNGQNLKGNIGNSLMTRIGTHFTYSSKQKKKKGAHITYA